ncbi:BZ3500_MvSof-1268-A1-R1_Chr4-3g07424 [Microbotryum saponariae]|uniref:BZ3500_MvSof-1268-A1-R1_Chr4-3g07424 protein n=1 Tax=Microbotryum saponariae TaxID=289078 RepID=A0A2X0KX49_9BASI|nr:BZ3500_MvSof-1268-A1-R1_Chr4-3g07424 [Microbotryum saponariae]SDA07087.1 BZ3501_MvSof-1269-A2-R1_Chr4-2g07133 [Microbotryum saponariae]
MTSTTCTRKGCGKTFDESNNTQADCQFHPGAPVFHEGMKSWSCCATTNKPVTAFDEFLALPGCATGTHSSEKPVAPPKPTVVESTPAPVATGVNGEETYGAPVTSLPPPPPRAASSSSATLKDRQPVSTEYVEEQDDPSLTVPAGARCKRRACGATFEPSTSRHDTECQYHIGVPLFHEGSKGYSCCKRRVLDFDDFLRIEGCRSGKHLFVGPKPKPGQEEEDQLVECRVDHYQSPRNVCVSIFGKQADKERSSVRFEVEEMHVDLLLPSRKRFTKSFSLYGPIDPATSTFKILGTKCEVTLAKADARSWPSITKLSEDVGFIPQLAFSAGGGRGTVGAKEAILDDQNKMAR